MNGYVIINGELLSFSEALRRAEEGWNKEQESKDEKSTSGN